MEVLSKKKKHKYIDIFLYCIITFLIVYCPQFPLVNSHHSDHLYSYDFNNNSLVMAMNIIVYLHCLIVYLLLNSKISITIVVYVSSSHKLATDSIPYLNTSVA